MTDVNMTDRPLSLRLVPTTPACPHCGRQGILAVDVPRAAVNVVGPRLAGTFQAVLCESCGLEDAYAAPLVLFFTVHGSVDEQVVQQCAELLRRWISHLTVPHITEETIAADIEAWRSGEFDEPDTSDQVVRPA
jgi:hypothetical protein